MTDHIPNPDALYRAVQEDHRLEKAAEGSQEALVKHRWFWTLSTDNPDRVTIKAFAERLGRSVSIVSRGAYGYQAFKAGSTELVPPSLSDCLALANVSEDQAAAVRAVAAATGISAKSVVSRENQLVQNVRSDAERRALERKTSVAEELEHSAKIAAAHRAADARTRTAKKATKSQRLLAAEGRMSTVLRVLKEVLADASAADYEGEEVEVLRKLMQQSRALLGLIDVKITGEDSGTDWDSELVTLGGAV